MWAATASGSITRRGLIVKPNLFVASLTVISLMPIIASAAPNAHARPRQHKPGVAKSSRRPGPVKRTRLLGRAYILNAARPGMDPDRGDHMALGRGMHPEQMDHMNAAVPAPAVSTPKR